MYCMVIVLIVHVLCGDCAELHILYGDSAEPT
jgi:hypothetical protein